jgi:cadmium resistance protein CadD (predicted permease)
MLTTGQMRYLGLIPMALGGYQILKLAISSFADGELKSEPSSDPMGFSAYFCFALVLLANNSDSISVMTPLLADLKPIFAPVCFIAAAMTAGLMGLIAENLTRHSATRNYFERIAKWALPVLLIGIGLLILTDEPAEIFVE